MGTQQVVHGAQRVKALIKRDILTSYFMRAFTSVLLCPS